MARPSLPRRSSRWPSERGIRVLQPRRVREPEAQEALRSLEPELQVVVAFGQILPRAVIDIAPRGTVNVHASLLPKLRGAAPIQWAIATGETETGVTTMLIDEGLDTGPLLLARSTPIGPDETAAELEPRLARLGAEVLLETVRGLEGGTLVPVPQEAGRATLAPILKKEDGRIDWSAPAAVIACRARGFSPWPGAFTLHEGRLLKARSRARGRGAPGGSGHGRGRVFGRCRRRLRRGHESPARRGPAGEPARHARVGLGGGRAPSPRLAAGLSVAASARAVALEILGRLRAGRVTVADALAGARRRSPRRAGPRLPPRARPRDAAAPGLAGSRAGRRCRAGRSTGSRRVSSTP